MKPLIILLLSILTHKHTNIEDSIDIESYASDMSAPKGEQ